MADAFASLNGQRVTVASLNMPYYGVPAGDVTLASTMTIPSTQAGLTLVFGNLSMTCTAYRMASFAGARSVRLVGGAGGWLQTLPAQAYNNPSGVMLSTVLNDAAMTVGETMGTFTDANLGMFYIRENAPAQRLLRMLCGPEWYVDIAGKTQVQTRPSKAITTPFTVNEWSGAKGSFVISTEDYLSWMPGNTFTSDTVPEVQTISMTTFEVTNDGTFRLKVLSTGAQDQA